MASNTNIDSYSSVFAGMYEASAHFRFSLLSLSVSKSHNAQTVNSPESYFFYCVNKHFANLFDFALSGLIDQEFQNFLLFEKTLELKKETYLEARNLFLQSLFQNLLSYATGFETIQYLINNEKMFKFDSLNSELYSLKFSDNHKIHQAKITAPDYLDNCLPNIAPGFLKMIETNWRTKTQYTNAINYNLTEPLKTAWLEEEQIWCFLIWTKCQNDKAQNLLKNLLLPYCIKASLIETQSSIVEINENNSSVGFLSTNKTQEKIELFEILSKKYFCNVDSLSVDKPLDLFLKVLLRDIEKNLNYYKTLNHSTLPGLVAAEQEIKEPIAIFDKNGKGKENNIRPLSALKYDHMALKKYLFLWEGWKNLIHPNTLFSVFGKDFTKEVSALLIHHSSEFSPIEKKFVDYLKTQYVFLDKSKILISDIEKTELLQQKRLPNFLSYPFASFEEMDFHPLSAIVVKNLIHYRFGNMFGLLSILLSEDTSNHSATNIHSIQHSYSLALNFIENIGWQQIARVFLTEKEHLDIFTHYLLGTKQFKDFKIEFVKIANSVGQTRQITKSFMYSRDFSLSLFLDFLKQRHALVRMSCPDVNAVAMEKLLLLLSIDKIGEEGEGNAEGDGNLLEITSVISETSKATNFVKSKSKTTKFKI